MMVLKRRQIVVLSLILMIVIAGLIQLSYNKGNNINSDEFAVNETTAKDVDTPKLGGAAFVDNSTGSAGNGTQITDKKDTDKKEKDDKNKDEKTNDKKAIQASKQADDFFAQAKIQKDIVRAQDTETLKEITESADATDIMKKEASQQMMKIITNSDKEMRIETLIKEKGFSDVVVLFADNGSIDIVVKAPALSTLEVAQIAEIASRQANVDMNNIYIRKEF
ncbi:MAG: SpoIIIAH-like family protein [Clostridiaceae bacterium]|nr:SpoIIIAH-like family protein [Clostridiaceae bacterium]